MTPAALLTQWARLFIDSVVRAGVRSAVISPGSRSTPFTWAALARSDLRCHVIVDERSAGYFALGQAAASGAPTLLICTSGTAAVNYAPAVAEAAQSGTPLLLLTADRPFELQGSGANQTIDQIKLYGDFVRGYFELGMPAADDAALRGLQRIGAQAVVLSRFPEPGPVQLNARARKPLEPAPSSDGSELSATVDALIARGPTAVHLPRSVADEAGIAALATSCRTARRGLIVCGPLGAARPHPATAVAELSAVTGFSVWAEATSQVRFSSPVEAQLDALGGLLGVDEFRRRFAPDLVLQIGAPPTAAGWERWLDQGPRVERQIVAPLPWPDPGATANRLVIGEPAHVLGAVANRLRHEPAPEAVLAERAAFRAWLEASSRVYWNAVDELLMPGRLSEASAVRAVVGALPPDGVLALGNSLPVREVDWYARSRAAQITVLHQRGASGIDGVLSSTIGAALELDRPTALVIGDLSLLHDIGGLLLARTLSSPLAIVALNNDGGRIFEQLPLFTTPGIESEKLSAWTTPHGLELFRAGALYDVPALRVTALAEFDHALATALKRRSATLIEVLVAPEGAREQLVQLRSRLNQHLCSEVGP